MQFFRTPDILFGLFDCDCTLPVTSNLNYYKKRTHGVSITIVTHRSFKLHNLYKDQDYQRIHQLSPSYAI
jgi:hypothetical protein